MVSSLLVNLDSLVFFFCFLVCLSWLLSLDEVLESPSVVLLFHLPLSLILLELVSIIMSLSFGLEVASFCMVVVFVLASSVVLSFLFVLLLLGVVGWRSGEVGGDGWDDRVCPTSGVIAIVDRSVILSPLLGVVRMWLSRSLFLGGKAALWRVGHASSGEKEERFFLVAGHAEVLLPSVFSLFVAAKVNFVCRPCFTSILGVVVTLVCLCFSPRLGDCCLPVLLGGLHHFDFLTIVNLHVVAVHLVRRGLWRETWLLRS